MVLDKAMSNFFSSSYLCLKASTFFTEVFKIKCSMNNIMYFSTNSSKAFQRFCAVALFKCFLLAEILFRILFLVWNDKISLDEHLFYNPLLVWSLRKLTYLNFTILRCFSLVLFFPVGLGHILYFGIDFNLLKATFELLVKNEKQFKVLNCDYFKWPKAKRNLVSKMSRIWHLFGRYRILLQRVLVSKRLKLHCETLNSFPNLSLRVRAKIIVFSSFVDLIFIVFILFLCK